MVPLRCLTETTAWEGESLEASYPMSANRDGICEADVFTGSWTVPCAVSKGTVFKLC